MNPGQHSLLPGGTGGKRSLLIIVGAFVLVGGSLLASTVISLDGTARRIAVVLHSLSFVLGFGTVLAVMFCGLRVVLKQLNFLDAARTAVMVDPGIWLGFALMVITSAFLGPNLGSHWLQAKVALALLSCVNGVLALPSMKVLLSLPATGGLEVVPGPLRLQLLTQTTISQVSWWTMVGISYLELRT
ncbi:MAG: hypothetical protein EOO70_03220 [Myxococcaceae bacterium]|nr:MAG: hypothetical protein EOO70_03220 [Myxococcaceae bacterium]